MAKNNNEKKEIRADSEKRVNKRINVTLPIMLPTGKAYTKNISTGGAYFELETSNADLYSIGQNIPIWVHASYGSNECFPQQLWLYVNAVIVRKENTWNLTQPDRWGIGLMFSGKLDIMLCTVNGFY